MEAIWVAAEMRAGGSYAHSLLAVAEMDAASPGAANDGQPPSKPGGEVHAE